MEQQRQRRLAAIAWAVSGAFGPVIPLVLFALHYRASKYVAYHALQAALSYAALISVAVVAGVVMLVATGVSLASDGMPQPDAAAPPVVQWAGVVAGVLVMVVYVVLIVASIVCALRVSRGQPVHFPIAHRIAAQLYDVGGSETESASAAQ